MKRLKYLFFSTVICLLFVSSIWAQQAVTEKKVYKNVEVETFTIKEGVEFESAQLENLMASVVFALKNTEKFENVKLSSQKSENVSNAPTLKIVGEVTNYDKGNRAARYLIGFGAGATKVNANVKFIDAATGNVLLEKQVDGVVWIGMFGGDSNGAKSGLAKEISNLAKKNFADKTKKK